MTNWPADTDLPERFSNPANATVLSFLGKRRRYAHGDLAEELLLLANGIPKAEKYCPDNLGFGYLFLFTSGRVIFAIAFGMSHLSFRLPSQGELVSKDGGKPNPELGPDWFSFPAFAGGREENRLRLSRWLKLAYEKALEA